MLSFDNMNGIAGIRGETDMQDFSLRVIPFAFLITAAHLLTIQGVIADDRAYENAEDLSAADILPGDLLKGEHHTLDDRVRNDGYLNYYTIKSDYGEFEAASTAMLKTRIGEINALAELDELSKTEVFIKAAADAGVGQLRSLKQFATHPVDTIVGIPSGIGRMFKRHSRQAGEAVDATKEYVAGDDEESDATNGENEGDLNAAVGLTESFFGVSKAERAWSRKLGTDPYSTNETLRDAIKELAWAERLGRFGMGFAGIPKIPGADIIGEVNDAVWTKDPYELQDLNRSRLVATDADEELIEKYLDNTRYSPSQQTLLTAAIAELADVEGRAGILSQSLNAKTGAEVGFFVRSVTMLAWYHLNQSPIVSVITDAAIPAGTTDNGKLVILLAADHIYWTEGVAQTAGIYHTALGADASTDVREVWFLGTISERCGHELAALGWEVHDELAQMLARESALE